MWRRLGPLVEIGQSEWLGSDGSLGRRHALESIPMEGLEPQTLNPSTLGQADSNPVCSDAGQGGGIGAQGFLPSDPVFFLRGSVGKSDWRAVCWLSRALKLGLRWNPLGDLKPGYFNR